MYLNTLFSTVVPLLSLLYLNIYTVKALRQIMRQDDITDDNGTGLHFMLRKSVSHDNLGVIIENPLFLKRSLSTDTINGNEATQRRESLAFGRKKDKVDHDPWLFSAILGTDFSVEHTLLFERR